MDLFLAEGTIIFDLVTNIRIAAMGELRMNFPEVFNGSLLPNLMPNKHIRKIHWSTAQSCTMSCGYCYLYRKPDCVHLSTVEAKGLISEVAAVGTEWIVFGGGDPLVRTDLLELIDFAKAAGLSVDLQTNSVGLGKLDVGRLFSTIDRLGLSLDSCDPKVHDRLRCRQGNFHETINALELALSSSVPVVVRTTLTRQNVGYVSQIAALIKKYEIAIKWSIREFAPLGRGKERESEYLLSPGVFEAEKKRILAACTIYGVSDKVNFVTREEMGSCYFMVGADGDVYSHPSVGDYFSIGNIRNKSLRELVDRLDYDPAKRAKRDCAFCETKITLTA